jgi:hypothetical protein
VEPCDAMLIVSVIWVVGATCWLLVVAVHVVVAAIGGVCAMFPCRLVVLRSSTIERHIWLRCSVPIFILSKSWSHKCKIMQIIHTNLQLTELQMQQMWTQSNFNNTFALLFFSNWTATWRISHILLSFKIIMMRKVSTSSFINCS